MGGSIRATVVALVLTAVASGAAAAQAAPKFGYVNSAAILAQAPGRAEAEAQFNNEVKAYQAQLQRMSDSLQLLAANFDKEAPKLDSATRERVYQEKENQRVRARAAETRRSMRNHLREMERQDPLAA